MERLEAGLMGNLTLISAPAGFGKTTLLSEWIHRSERPTAWLSLDEGDNDPARFLAYVVAALQTVEEDIGKAMLSALQSPQPSLMEVLLAGLINEIAEIPDPFALVLDDYHLIKAEPIHNGLAFLLDHLPPRMHLVLVTREDPPLPLPRLRVRGQVTEIRADDLRFTADEAAAFLDRALGLALDPGIVAALEARTEGWIAGLQLAALSMRDRSDAADFVAAFSGSHRHVIDYLADEVLARQPEEVRGFLCQTAILDRLTAPLCDAVTGREDSQALLRQLEQANLFLVPLDDRREWYRYHVLFADFLRTELDAESQAALHLKAARWFAAHDLWPEAVGHALASGDVDEAAQAIALAAKGALRAGSFMTLLGWLDALPDEVVRSPGRGGAVPGRTRYVQRCCPVPDRSARPGRCVCGCR
jgi:LuxR family maltose regulon positive regulatory protein